MGTPRKLTKVDEGAGKKAQGKAKGKKGAAVKGQLRCIPESNSENVLE